jgi:hypothetical protein
MKRLASFAALFAAALASSCGPTCADQATCDDCVAISCVWIDDGAEPATCKARGEERDLPPEDVSIVAQECGPRSGF